MLCEDCQKNEATIHLSRKVNNQEVVLNLCAECAVRRGFSNPLKNMPFPLADFLSSMVGEHATQAPGQLLEKSCPECNLSYETFSKTGRLGCGACFSAFRQPLADLLRKIHGSNLHRGKRPRESSTAMEPLKEEARLKDELTKAIATEDFERAAQLRDMLKDIQHKLQVSDV